MTVRDRRTIRKTVNRRQSGFTLVEMSVAIVILGILSMGITSFMTPLMNLMAHKNFVNGPATEARLAMAKMIRDINQIADNESVITANTGTLSFTNSSSETVTYALSSGTMTRNSVTIAKFITSLAFTYYNISNGVISTPSVSPNETDIRRIQAQITVSAGGETATIRGQMFPRNLAGG